MFSRSTLLLLLVAGSPGCAKAHYVTSASKEPSGARAEPYAGYDHDGEIYADAEVAMSSPAEMREREPLRRRIASRSVPRSEAASPAPPAQDTIGEEAIVAGDEAEPAIEPVEHEPHDRQIVYTASLRLSVFNLEEASRKAEVLPERLGGYIHAMSQGQMVMRIPSKNLRPAMQELEALGVVEHRSLQAQDVTAEFVDIDARIRVLEETQKQMVELLAKARTVDEALAVRKALDQITMELEVLKGRMRQLQNMISYSTLTVTLVERGPHVVTPSSRDPFPWVDDLGVEATEWK